MKKIFLVVIFLMAMSGCASNIQNLQRATAMSIEGDYLPEDIQVDDIDRSAMNVNWSATTRHGKKYRCSADDMVRKTVCRDK